MSVFWIKDTGATGLYFESKTDYRMNELYSAPKRKKNYIIFTIV